MNLINGNCLEELKKLEANSVDAIITDPPYGLSFMGKDWDHGVPVEAFWKEMLRVAKPGSMLMAFGGTRTYRRLTCAIEDAGWEIRDCISWVYGSGFPKSLDISKAIDKTLGAEREVIGTRKHPTLKDTSKLEEQANAAHGENGWSREWDLTAPSTDQATSWQGYGTALKPAWEPIVLAMKPLEGTFAKNAMKWGVAGLWIDGCRVGENPGYRYNADKNGTTFHGKQGERIPQTSAKKGSAVIESTKGRWPANLIHDGSEEVLECFPNTKSGAMKREVEAYDGESVTGMLRGKSGPSNQYGDSGSAARFFYCAKATKKEKGKDNKHPTVKPLALMRYLCRLVRMPEKGVILDPFMGSGTTGVAAITEGFDFIGIELDKEYYGYASRRLNEIN